MATSVLASVFESDTVKRFGRACVIPRPHPALTSPSGSTSEGDPKDLHSSSEESSCCQVYFIPDYAMEVYSCRCPADNQLEHALKNDQWTLRTPLTAHSSTLSGKRAWDAVVGNAPPVQSYKLQFVSRVDNRVLSVFDVQLLQPSDPLPYAAASMMFNDRAKAPTIPPEFLSALSSILMAVILPIIGAIVFLYITKSLGQEGSWVGFGGGNDASQLTRIQTFLDRHNATLADMAQRHELQEKDGVLQVGRGNWTFHTAGDELSIRHNDISLLSIHSDSIIGSLNSLAENVNPGPQQQLCLGKGGEFCLTVDDYGMSLWVEHRQFKVAKFGTSKERFIVMRTPNKAGTGQYWSFEKQGMLKADDT